MNAFKLIAMLFALCSSAFTAEIDHDEMIEDDNVDGGVHDPILVSHVSTRNLLSLNLQGIEDFPIQLRNTPARERADELVAIKKFFVDKFGPCALYMEPVLSPDGNLIATKNKHIAVVWRREHDGIKLLFILDGHQDKISRVQFSAHTNQIITFSKDKTVQFWSVESGELEYGLPEHSSEVVDISFNDDGSECAVTTKHGSAYIWLLPHGIE